MCENLVNTIAQLFFFIRSGINYCGFYNMVDQLIPDNCFAGLKYRTFEIVLFA